MNFQIDGNDKLNSIPGACVSLPILMVTLFFALTRLQVLVDFGNTTHQITTEYGDVNDVLYQNETGFNVAFNLIKEDFSFVEDGEPVSQSNEYFET